MFRKEKKFQRELKELLKYEDEGLEIVNQYIQSPKRTKESLLLTCISITALVLFSVCTIVFNSESLKVVFGMLTILSAIETCIYATERKYLKEIVGKKNYSYIINSLKKQEVENGKTVRKVYQTKKNKIYYLKY